MSFPPCFWTFPIPTFVWPPYITAQNFGPPGVAAEPWQQLRTFRQVALPPSKIVLILSRSPWIVQWPSSPSFWSEKIHENPWKSRRFQDFNPETTFCWKGSPKKKKASHPNGLTLWPRSQLMSQERLFRFEAQGLGEPAANIKPKTWFLDHKQCSWPSMM